MRHPPIARRPLIRLLALVAAVAASPPAYAGVYVGGPWNAPSSWSDGQVPNRFTYAEFTDARTGNVQLNSGGQARYGGFQRRDERLSSNPGRRA